MEETKVQEVKNANNSELGDEINRSDSNLGYNSKIFHQEIVMSNKKLDKYNSKEKLEQEEKWMEDSTAKLIAGNDQQTPASL